MGGGESMAAGPWEDKGSLFHCLVLSQREVGCMETCQAAENGPGWHKRLGGAQGLIKEAIFLGEERSTVEDLLGCLDKLDSRVLSGMWCCWKVKSHNPHFTQPRISLTEVFRHKLFQIYHNAISRGLKQGNKGTYKQWKSDTLMRLYAENNGTMKV